jgi:hypothetical protein
MFITMINIPLLRSILLGVLAVYKHIAPNGAML